VTSPVTQDADWTAPLLALMGPQLGGVILTEDAEESWCAVYSALAMPQSPLRAVPATVTSEQLNGALDLATTLATGKTVMQAGLLRPDDISNLLIRRATRMENLSVALLGDALDRGALMLAVSDDSLEDEDAMSAILTERLTFDVRQPVANPLDLKAMQKARALLPKVQISADWIESLCTACLSLGIGSPRIGVFAVATAKGLAALAGRRFVEEEDVTRAARLVLAHRATTLPAPSEQDQQVPPPSDQAPTEETSSSQPKPADAEVVVASVKTSLPNDVLQLLAQGKGRRAAQRGRNEKRKKALSAQRGRVTGTMRASNIARQRLNILATLRAAAPWQVLRRREQIDRLIVLRDDLRVSRRKQRTEATAIFAVDASGSTAFQRLAEAKGAVETLLSECYVRRDRVAMIAFRSKTAEVLLPPSRSLERARRALTALAGGGGTPMASALDQVYAIADQVKRSGGKPIVILLTDGRANVTRTGEGDKVKAMAEAEDAAKKFAGEGFESMVMDVSPEPQKAARSLAQQLDGRYLHLPRAGASELAAPVRAALRQATR
jgi:magnesium chelatase subunit D